MSFEPFKFSEELLQAIEQAKFTRASKIQQIVIPEVLEGKDLLISAHSGSGKSASFVLPLIQRLLDNPRKTVEETESNDESSRPVHGPRALILTPTRELANQVSACIRRFTRELDLRYGILVGGAPYPPQVRMLKKPVDFLVATPGRLLDHIKNNRVNFDFVEFLVIDECNRLIDMGIADEIREIVQSLPSNTESPDSKRQTLIFTDCLGGDEIEQLSSEFQTDPVRFELARSKQSYRTLNQCMYIADEGEHKFKLTQSIVQTTESDCILIFSNSQKRLKEFSSYLIQQEQFSSENEFELSYQEKQLLLCDDDSNQKSAIKENALIQIVHLDLPDDILVFLQRLESAIDTQSEQESCILVGSEDWSILHQIERYIGKTLTRKKIQGLEPESTEPRVGSKLSGSNESTKESQTKNRNPYSGRRQNGSNTQKPRNKNRNNKQQGNATNKRNNKKQNRAKNPNSQPQNNFNADPFSDDRDMTWKAYISNMSNGNNQGNGNGKANNKAKGNNGNGRRNNKGRNRNRNSNNGFDLNHSPMAVSAKAVREMSNDEWIEDTESKKPNVQIRVKGQNKNIQNEHTHGEKSYSEIEDRIDGKLGINK